MSEPTPGFRNSLFSRSALLQRIRENLQILRAASRVRLAAPAAPNGVPIHLIDDRHDRPISAHAGSTVLHILLFAALFAFLAHPAVNKLVKQVPVPPIFSGLTYTPPKSPASSDTNQSGKAGGGGNDNPLPPKSGQLAPLSSLVLSPPRLPDGRTHPLPETVVIYDPNAPEMVAPAKELGLPWMNARTPSDGPGHHGGGNNPGNTMGRGDIYGDGEGDQPGPYTGPVSSYVSCKVCPDPQYSDEARKVKLQGHVMLRVLVGADGRAQDIRIAQGLGLGLDENAIEAVRHWQFLPARDAARHPIASWITIEAVFRLF